MSCTTKKTMDLSSMTREELEAYAMQVSSEKEELAAKVLWYEEQYRLGRARRFGPSSEQTPFDQLSFFNEVEAEAYGKVLTEPTLSEVKPPRNIKKKGHKDKITKPLPTTVINYRLTGEDLVCSKCGDKLQEMKTEIRKELTVIPAQVQVTEHVQHVYVCRSCDRAGTESNIVSAPMPNPVLRNSLASPSMIAYIMNRKYAEAIPLYRQEQQFKKYGLQLSRQTLANWMIKSSEHHLKPLYDLMHKELVKRSVLHADETVLEVLCEPGRDAASDSYMWLYRTSGDSVPIVLYDYKPGRSGNYPKEFLKGFKGFLHADGYAGYHKLSESVDAKPPDVVLVGCFAHARRKWDEALKGISEKEGINAYNIRTGLEYCNTLFRLEKEMKDLSPEKRYLRRLEEAKPVVEAYFSWVKSIEDKVVPKSLIGQAVIYSLNQEKYLRNYLLDGRLELSNNRAERSIKPFVIGRNNWLFSNTPRGADASAIIYSIIETAKENNLNPFPYLEYLFKRLPNMDKGDTEALSELFPWSDRIPESCRNLTCRSEL